MVWTLPPPPSNQQHERHQVLARHVLGEAAGVAALVALLELLGRAASDGEVLAADRDVPPVDLAEAHDVWRRREPGEVPVLVLPGPGEDAHLVEGAGVEDAVEALADGVLAARVLAGDAVRLAAGVCELDAFPELVEPVLPHHAPAPPRPRALARPRGVGRG